MLKALGRSLALSSAVMIPGLLLLYNGAQIPGLLWLFGGSFAMVAWTYRKPWRLTAFSCLLPPVMAALCYLIQLGLFSGAGVNGILVIGAVAVGAGVGWLRGQTHEIYEEKGQFFARRTLTYLAVWAAAYAITQLMAFSATNVLAVRAGLLTGAFSTAMLAAVSIIVLMKRNAAIRATTSLLVIGFAAALPCLPSPTLAQWATGNQAPPVAELLPGIMSHVRSVLGNKGVFVDSGSIQSVSPDEAAVQLTVSFKEGATLHPWMTLRRYASYVDPSQEVNEGTHDRGNGYFESVASRAKENYLVVVSIQYGPELGEAGGFTAGVIIINVADVAVEALDLESAGPAAPPVTSQTPVFPSEERGGEQWDDGSQDIREGDSGAGVIVKNIDPNDAAGATALIATILVASGVAASVAQAAAAAAQTGGHATANQISELIAQSAEDPANPDKALGDELGRVETLIRGLPNSNITDWARDNVQQIKENVLNRGVQDPDRNVLPAAADIKSAKTVADELEDELARQVKRQRRDDNYRAGINRNMAWTQKQLLPTVETAAWITFGVSGGAGVGAYGATAAAASGWGPGMSAFLGGSLGNSTVMVVQDHLTGETNNRTARTVVTAVMGGAGGLASSAMSTMAGKLGTAAAYGASESLIQQVAVGQEPVSGANLVEGGLANAMQEGAGNVVEAAGERTVGEFVGGMLRR